MFYLIGAGIVLAAVVVLTIMICVALGIRYIPNDKVAVLEKLWSGKGSVTEGRLIALNGEAGYQADVLRGGIHFWMFCWQYKIHKMPLVTIPQGQIAYIYARDGSPLPPEQSLGRVVDCNNFQDAKAFLAAGDDGHLRGQRGRQRSILREGVYAINQAAFVVITEATVFHLRMDDSNMVLGWQQELTKVNGFRPIVIGIQASDDDVVMDSIGIVTIHDGPSLSAGEIIAPPVGGETGSAGYHNNYQDPEAFLKAGGRRGRQHAVVTDGTYFINRWLATVELIPKTLIPIGAVGVVNSYYGVEGADVSGKDFRHGERVATGQKGVWAVPLGPGKYAFNTYAASIVLVPTTNFVLNWITGRTESHRYDENLKSVDLVTKDAYEPELPLSVVVHIDYQKAPGVVQRFGDIKKLITQTIDPMLSAYFRDVAHKKTMLELLQMRDVIQQEARNSLHDKFMAFDIECVDVLIGKPETKGEGKIEQLLEQLRLRQLSIEQIETYERQQKAAAKQRELNEQQAMAAKQAELTNSQIQIRIAENQGDADLARSRKQAEQLVVMAKAQSEQQVLEGKGSAEKTRQIGQAEAQVQQLKIASYGDPRLYALNLVATQLANSKQPLVPDRVFITGSGDGQPTGGLLTTLMSLLVAEKAGFEVKATSVGMPVAADAVAK